MSSLDYSTIRQYQDDSENLSWEDISLIEEAFNEIPDDQLRDLRENALVDDMLDELESHATPMEKAIYNYVSEQFGESEAQDPSWSITPLAEYLNKEFNLG